MSIGVACGESFGDYCLTTTTTNATSKSTKEQQQQKREDMQKLQQLVFKDIPDGKIPAADIRQALLQGGGPADTDAAADK
jgi:hypothetical protein